MTYFNILGKVWVIVSINVARKRRYLLSVLAEIKITLSYQKPFVFSVSVLFFFWNIYLKIKFTGKKWSDMHFL